MAPRTLPASTHPYFESEFLPIALSHDLLSLDVVQTFQSLVDGDALVSWELGRKGTHISSKFETAAGSEDTLTSPDPNDEDYESLCKAHIQQAIRIIQSEEDVVGRVANQIVAKEILAKWREQNGFIRFLDGNPANCNLNNLQRVSGVDAMNHMDWKVDWDIDLSDEQIAFVRANAANFAHALG